MARVSLLVITCALMFYPFGAVAHDATARDDLSGEAVRAIGDAVMGAAVDEEAVVERDQTQGAGAGANDREAMQEMRARLFDALAGKDGAGQ
jgi:hypothetical protein